MNSLETRIGILFLVAVIFTFGSISISYLPSGQLAAISGAGSQLIGEWNFEEGSGTTVGDSAGGSPGTISGGVTWITGRVGAHALQFDGVNGKVSVSNPSAFNFNNATSPNFTLSAWVYLSSNVCGSSKCTILSSAPSSGTGGYRFIVGSSLQPELYLRNPDDLQGTSNSVTVGAWHHVVAVYVASTSVTFYVDGVQKGVKTLAAGVVPGSTPTFNIGSDANVNQYFPGMIDDVRVYSRDLSALEVSDLYSTSVQTTDSTPPPPPPPPPPPTSTTGVTPVNGVYTVNAAGGTNTFTTIQACADVVKPGETCRVYAGNYPERVFTKAAGISGSPITFQGESGVMMQGFEVKHDYIKIDGFDITNTLNTACAVLNSDMGGIDLLANNAIITNNYVHDLVGPGIYGYYSYTNNYIANNRINHTQSGIVASGSNWTVEKNEVYRLSSYCANMDVDYMRFFGTGHVFRSNYMHGVLVTDPVIAHVDCFQTFDNNAIKVTNNVLIEKNMCLDGMDAFIAEGKYAQQTSNITIRNNVFANVSTPDTSFNIAMNDVPSVNVYNNTLVNINGGGISSSNTNSTSLKYLTAKNNIIYLFGSYKPFGYPAGDTTLVEGYNLVMARDGTARSTTLASTDIVQTPTFANTANVVGPDGIPFTADDGLIPAGGSAVCGKGENGTDIGAYACPAVQTPTFSGTYYVDYANGNDANSGYSQTDAWQHAPGDPNATLKALAATPAPGSTILFKGGVVYRGMIVAKNSGSSGAPILYKGDGWGSSKAILDGSDLLTGWTRCSSQSACGNSPNWSNMYTTTAPAISFIDSEMGLSLNLYQGTQPLSVAQYPQSTSPLYEIVTNYYSVPASSVTGTTITDSRLSTLGGSSLVGSYVYILDRGNDISIRKILSYSSNTITFSSVLVNTGSPNLYAIANSSSGAVLNSPGQYYVDESTRKIYLWPIGGADPSGNTTVSTRYAGFDLNGKSYVTVEGFIIQKQTADGSVSSVNGKEGMAIKNPGSNSIIRNNEITGVHTLQESATIGSSATVSNVQVDGNYIHDTRGNGRSVSLAGSSITVSNNRFERVARTPIYLPGTNSTISNNTILDSRGVHSNGISLYEGANNVLVSRNVVMNSNIALTIQNSGNITLVNNIFDSGMSRTDSVPTQSVVATFGGVSGTNKIINNIILGSLAIAGQNNDHVALRIDGTGDTFGTKYIVKNNILDGSLITNTVSPDIAANLSTWDTTSKVETSMSSLFSNYAAGNYHYISTNPAINAGVDLSSYGYTTDFDSVSRPQNSLWDIGAFEYQGAVASLVGDFDGDGRVTTLDWSYMNSVWGTSDAKADLNKDGKVNTLDFGILVKNWTN